MFNINAVLRKRFTYKIKSFKRKVTKEYRKGSRISCNKDKLKGYLGNLPVRRFTQRFEPNSATSSCIEHLFISARLFNKPVVLNLL